jgi:predicted metal-dependent phosphotriesterase family hydrolase
VSRNGELLPETKAVIAMIAKYNLALATGHVSAQEGLLILREARRQGVRRMVVTHAMNPPIAMTVAQMQEAAKEGAFIEFVGGALKTAEDQARMDRFADAIKKLGANVTILSSDLGQQGNALPADGFAAFLAAMRARGISVADIETMTRRNPATFLDLK